MAIFSALLSFVFKKLGNIVQAILGWSVTALFGRLPSAKQTALSGALIAALLWPVLVVGVFFPAVTAWAVAFAPVHKWVGDDVVRIVTIALAVIVPPIIGLITRWVAPAKNLHGGVLRTMLMGYPLTLGYAVSCIVTAVTVPLVKVGSIVRRWADEHVFVQPLEGKYALALGDLVAACKAAGVDVEVEPVPTSMGLSTRVLRWFARGALDPIMAADPKRLVAKNLQIYLYPADLLLRGEAKLTARVRARITQSMLERHAFLVPDKEAQDIQEELMRMWGVLERHHSPDEIGGLARQRMHEIAHDLDRAFIPFDQWVVLDRSLRRLEQELGGGTRIKDDAAVTRQEEKTTMEAHQHDHDRAAAPSEVPTVELVKEALDEAKQLVKLEVALAKNEVKEELAAAKTSAIAFGVAGLTAILGLALLFVALALAIAPRPIPALVIGGVLLAMAGGAAFFGVKHLPKKPLDRTRRRLQTDLKQLKERVA